MICIIDGKPHVAMISCHFDSTFSFYDGEKWIRKARTVPRRVLDDRELPASERARALARMAENGVSPS